MRSSNDPFLVALKNSLNSLVEASPTEAVEQVALNSIDQLAGKLGVSPLHAYAHLGHLLYTRETSNGE